MVADGDSELGTISENPIFAFRPFQHKLQKKCSQNVPPFSGGQSSLVGNGCGAEKCHLNPRHPENMWILTESGGRPKQYL